MQLGVKSCELHGDVTQALRYLALQRFRDNEVDVMVSASLTRFIAPNLTGSKASCDVQNSIVKNVHCSKLCPLFSWIRFALMSLQEAWTFLEYRLWLMQRCLEALARTYHYYPSLDMYAMLMLQNNESDSYDGSCQYLCSWTPSSNMLHFNTLLY